MILRPLRSMDLSLLLFLCLSTPALAFEDPFDCHFQVKGLKYDLSPLKDEVTATRTRPTPPTSEIDSVRISLCSDLMPQKEVSDADQCPPGTRICLTKTNHKEGESDRITGVVPLAQSIALNASYMPLSSPTKGVSILLHGAPYPHPIDAADVDQSVNISVLCTPGSESQPTIKSYSGERLELEWLSEAGCGFAAEDDEKHDDSNPGNGGAPRSTSLSSVGWFLLLLLIAFGVYMGLGAYYNYSTYGARGIDLIPHRDFWIEVPWMLRDVVSHLCSTVRPRRSSSHRGGYIAV